MYVYTESGILIERIKYNSVAEKCGKPIGISENGLNLVFRKSDSSPDICLV